MSKNPQCKSNDDGDEEEADDDDDVDDDDDGDDETLRRGCCVKRLTRHMARVPLSGGEGGSVRSTLGAYIASQEAMDQY